MTPRRSAAIVFCARMENSNGARGGGSEPSDDHAANSAPPGSLLEILITMHRVLDSGSPTTRTAFFITKCLQTRDYQSKTAARVGAANTRCWFDVPLAELSAFDHARFVYLFINLVYNPYKHLSVRQDVGEWDDKGESISSDIQLVACTPDNAARYFNWIHAAHPRLAALLQPLCVPLSPEAQSTPNFYERLRQNAKATQQRFATLVRKIGDTVATRHLRAGETHEKVVDQAQRVQYARLHSMLAKEHKMLAKELGVPIGMVHLLHLWALDVARDERIHKRLERVAEAIGAGETPVNSTEAPAATILGAPTSMPKHNVRARNSITQ